VEGDLCILVTKGFSLVLQFISTDIALVDECVIGHALAQKIASGQTRMAEFEVEGVVGRQPVKGVEFGKLFQGDHLTDIRPHIEGELLEIDVYPMDDPIDEF
jgi:hypothetical protein